MTVERYLAIHYMIPEKPAVLPLPDEAFTRLWKEAEGEAALRFLADAFKLPVEHFQLQEPAAVQIRFISTLGGGKATSNLCRLPCRFLQFGGPDRWL